MGGLFGGKKTSSSTSTPYTGQYADQINSFYNNTLKKNLNTPAAAYTGDLSAPLSGTQQNVLSDFGNLVDTQALTDTIGGKYLDPSSNPYLDQYYNQAADKVRSTLADNNNYVNSQFNTRGLYNSSARQETLQKQADKATDTMADMATNIYGGAYNQERSNQMSAINQLGSLFGSLFDMGTTEQQNSQDSLTRDYSEWLRQQGVDQNDINNMLQYFGLVQNPSKTTTEKSSPGIGSTLLGK